MKDRIYICHTYYHVYIACLKEMAFRRVLPAGKDAGETCLLLSDMSNDFEALPERAKDCPLFTETMTFHEKAESAYPELLPLKQDTGSAVGNLKNRIRFCRRLGELTGKCLPVDLRLYRDIYVFCDSDPIGYYLNYAGIRYHAVEDGLNCLKYFDAAHFDNRDHFRIKALLAKTGLIFMQNGYGRTCIDMEVNDISAIPYPCPKYVELPRRELTKPLTDADKDVLLSLFLADKETLLKELKKAEGKPCVLILSEPLCGEETRKRLFADIVRDYGTVDGKETFVLMKQHPRDLVSYKEALPDVLVLSGRFPMEILNLIPGLSIDRVVSVYTVVDALDFVKEKIYLGHDFMDRYEDPSVHRKNEQIGAA